MKTMLISTNIFFKPLLCVLFLFSLHGFAQENYKSGPNSWTYENIPKGSVTKYQWESTIYPNTSRDYYLYIPAQYNPEFPAALMVFQDGHAYISEDGDFKTSTVFDNLISQGKMPVTIGLFINPGHDKNDSPIESPWKASNRSKEYDEVSETYARFLTEELIPEVQKNYNISDDPKMRAIGGLSSGGISAFSAAWFMPDQFNKVLSHYGSFTNIREGHSYPSMIRKAETKDIKILLQDGINDLDNEYGNWWLANKQMEAALKYKNYDYLFVSGSGGHDSKQPGSEFPQNLTWLWSDMVNKMIPSGVYTSDDLVAVDTLMSGETMHLAEMTFSTKTFSPKDGVKEIADKTNEQIIIIKLGTFKISLDKKTETFGPNSVIVILPGDHLKISADSPSSSYYTMQYASKENPNLRRGKKEGGSVIINYEKVDYNTHDRGGIRNYFHRATAMCPYYEMHITNLNSGIKSHEPHVHSAAEIVIVTKGNTQMEIGNEIYDAKVGDVYYLASNVPHAIRNTGAEQCQYFAFQWE